MQNKKRLSLVICIIIACALLTVCSYVQKNCEKILYPRRFGEYVEKYSREYNVDEYIIYSVIKVESNFDENAVSSVGASGLMQLMPQTYEWLCFKNGEEKKNIFDPEENIKYGVLYLSMLYSRYNDWEKALCAYNAGMGNVDKWLQSDSFEIEFEETEIYIYKLRVAQEKYLKLYYDGGI